MCHDLGADWCDPDESLLHSSPSVAEAKQGGLLCHFSGNISCVNLCNIVRQEEKDGNVDFRQWSNVMSKTKKEKFGPARVFARK